MGVLECILRRQLDSIIFSYIAFKFNGLIEEKYLTLISNLLVRLNTENIIEALLLVQKLL